MYGTTEFFSESDSTVARLVQGMIKRDGLEIAVEAKPVAGDKSRITRLQEASTYPVVASYDIISHVPVKLSSNLPTTKTRV